MLENDKAALRRAVRARYPGDEVWKRESAALCSSILGWERYRQAQYVGGYVPVRREADVRDVLRDVLRKGKLLALPRCGEAPHMTMRVVRSMEELVIGRYGIPEPAENSEIIPVHHLDLLIVPLEGIDRRGMRLGKGGGYYDALLSRERCFTLGAVMSWQWIDAVPSDPWDQGLDAAADHQGICLLK